jgi:uncharacterized protein
MPISVAPVALPGSETTPKSVPASARPSVGPVLPLTASGGDHGGDLLGAGDHPTQTTSDPIAVKILSRGETLAAPAGRADNFSWPRPGSDASARPEVSREPIAAAPDTGKTRHPGEGRWQKPSRRQEGCEEETRTRFARQRTGLVAQIL